MEFKALAQTRTAKRTVAKADVPQNIAVRLESIEIDPKKPSFYVGLNAITNEPVRIRMMNVDEGIVVNQRQGEDSAAIQARLKEQYVGNGEKHRPKPSEINDPQHKAHCEPGGLLMFTKTLKNEDGSYRAHWVETLEKSPGAGCDQVTAHIRIEDLRNEKKEKIGTQVCADVIKPSAAVFLTKDNMVSALTSIYANQSADGTEKLKPFAFYRLLSADDHKLVLPAARGNAQYLEEEHMDHDTGESYTMRYAAPGDQTVIGLMSPENTSQDALMIRAALFGLDDNPGYPKYEGLDPAVEADLKNVTDYVRAGQLLVEVVPGHRISAGPATRASIIKSVQSNSKNPLNTVYTRRNDQGYTIERRFADTFLTTKIGKDGHRFFTKGMPVELFAKGLTIDKVSTANDLASIKEDVPDVAAEAVGEAESVALDAVSAEDVDAQLQQSQQALEATM